VLRVEELIEDRPELMAAVRPLLEARNAIERQVSELDRRVMKLARRDAQVQRFMTVPGVGPITALAFKASTWPPVRTRSVGAQFSPFGFTRGSLTLLCGGFFVFSASFLRLSASRILTSSS
jgi:transposase